MAEQRRYDVVLTGQIEPDRAQEEVIQALAVMFRIEPARAERMLLRAPRVLRRDAPARKAGRYFRVLTQAGAEVAIEPVGVGGLREPPAADGAGGAAAVPYSTLADEQEPPGTAPASACFSEPAAVADEAPTLSPATVPLPPRRGLALAALLAFLLGGGSGYQLAVWRTPPPLPAPVPVVAPAPTPAPPPAPEPAPASVAMAVPAPPPAADPILPTPATPFGLQPGQAAADLALTPTSGAVQALLQVPTPHPLFDRYQVRLGADGLLCWLEARALVGDIGPDGAALRAVFDRLEGELAAAYGAGARSDVQLAGSQLTAPEQWMDALLRRERYLNGLWSAATGAALPAGIQRVVVRASAESADTGAVNLEFDFGAGCPSVP